MLSIKTKHGNFGNFKNLLLYMKDEHLEEVEIELYYIFDKVGVKHTLSINEVKKIVKA